ncbi:MAG: FAD-dependent oxidoreductase [Actinomycetota bacterium]|nr:FAD-dependent oxidoreductase [Actinomycetota bacterium]
MVMGLLLARAGVEVTVLEKHGDFLRDFRGDTVHPSTLALLDDLGLGERFAALPQSRLQEVALPVDEQQTMLRIADFRRLARFGVRHPYVAMVPQWDLLNLLADAGEREPTFTLRMSTEATELLREPGTGRVDGVRYRTADGTTGELHADLTVACDGRTSMARAGAALDVTEYPVSFDAWWFRLPRRDGDDMAALSPRVGRGRACIVIPREGYFQIAYIGPKGTDAALRAAGVEAFRRDVAEVCPVFADRVDSLESMDDVKHLDVRLNRLRRWHVDGLLCIGDAAHAMSPVGGVGINLAVQDAVAAATLLAGPLRENRVTDRDLGAVRRRRLTPTRLVQGLQRVMHRVVIDAVLTGEPVRPPKALLRIVKAVPQVTAVPALFIGVGVRPERAPAFARRPAVAARD